MKLSDYRKLFDKKPCYDAIEWLKTQPDIQTAWQNCKRGDWMIWALQHGECLPPKRFWVRLAWRCARAAKKYAAYAYANARANARAYAYANARAAADDAARAAAADAARAAAADAAASAFAARAAAADAYYAELKAQEDWIRKEIPDFPLQGNR